MKFFESIEICYRKYCTFEGRASRSEYWWFVCYLLVFYLLLLFLLFFICEQRCEGMRVVEDRILGLSILYCSANFFPLLACQVRRLHDTSKSGTYWFLALIPYAGSVIMLVLMVMPSHGDNQYGSKPDK